VYYDEAPDTKGPHHRAAPRHGAPLIRLLAPGGRSCSASSTPAAASQAGIAGTPEGYYGNVRAFASPVAVAIRAASSAPSPVSYAVEPVRRAKGEVNMERVRSVADLMALRGRPIFSVADWQCGARVPPGPGVGRDVTKAGFGD
jgi:hypothetical protein